MDESSKDDITQVTAKENSILIETFTEQEVREAIFQMKQNKAPCPNGFLVEFYQVFGVL